MLTASELFAKFLIGFAYMGTFLLIVFMSFAAWDKYQETKRRKAQEPAVVIFHKKGSGLL